MNESQKETETEIRRRSKSSFSIFGPVKSSIPTPPNLGSSIQMHASIELALTVDGFHPVLVLLVFLLEFIRQSIYLLLLKVYFLLVILHLLLERLDLLLSLTALRGQQAIILLQLFDYFFVLLFQLI